LSIRIALIAATLILGSALAGERPSLIEVRGPPLSTRTEAAEIAQVTRAEGIRTRVERRYEHGAGWSWVVVVRRPGTVDDARMIARALAQSTGHSFVVLGAPAEPPDTSDEPPAVYQDDASTILGIARRRNSPHDAAVRLERADALTFRYVRTLSDGARIAHTYARHDGRIYLRFHPEGAGAEQAATYLIADGQAWAARGDGPLTATDYHRTRDTIQRFSPERVLQPALSAGASLGAPRESIATTVARDGTIQLRVVDGSSTVVPELHLDPATARVVRVVAPLEGLAIIHELGGEPIGDLRLPRVQVTRRGTVVLDRVELVDLQLGAPQELAWFLTPGAGPI